METKNPTKTLLFWKPKRCRKPKMVGTATATCSALTIMDFSRMALRGDGTFYVIDAATADVGRAIIRIYDENKSTPEKFTVSVSDTNGKIIAVGDRAVQALKGAGQSISLWESRIQEQGRVTDQQSKALT
jgi:hypothetical protein